MNDPIQKFDDWFQEARKAQKKLPEAATLATASKLGRPSARIVLLKSVKNGRFQFYTNYESPKAKDLLENPQGCLVFYWSSLDYQVRVEGSVEKTTETESDAYWKTRPRESQIEAWASAQSAPIDNRAVLVERFQAIKNKFKDREVPRPKNWGGFQLSPERIEFWHGREHRLHDREVFQRRNGSWEKEFLSP